ncbi:MAG: dihydroorotate dehydrogenase electron transfer subunit [Candidatus Eisenbacteria bacterium]
MPLPSPRIVSAEVVRNDPLTKEIREIVFRLPDDWGPAEPGQFVQVDCRPADPFVLRRPFSIARTRRVGGEFHLHLVFAPVGDGTRVLAAGRPGEHVSIVGPLGRGFRPIPGRRPILVGGGRGVAPLLSLGDAIRATHPEGILLFGVRGPDQLHELEDPAYPVEIATQDGSVGFRGHLLGLLDSLLEAGRIAPAHDAIYSCGPNPMLHALSDWAIARGFPAQVSLETLFGCGFGICAGCAVPVKQEAGEEGDEFGHYRFACVDGPVFDAERVDWEGVRE